MILISCRGPKEVQSTQENFRVSELINKCSENYVYRNIVREDIVIVDYYQDIYNYHIFCDNAFIYGQNLDGKIVGIVVAQISDSLQRGSIIKLSTPSFRPEDLCSEGIVRLKRSSLEYDNIIFCYLDTVYYSDYTIVY